MLTRHFWAVNSFNSVLHTYTPKNSPHSVCVCVFDSHARVCFLHPYVCACVKHLHCSSCLGRSIGPGKQCLVLSFVFYVPSKPGAQAALCGQEVAGLAPDWPMQLFTTVGHIHLCACLCTCVYMWVCLHAPMSVACIMHVWMHNVYVCTRECVCVYFCW